MNIALVATLFPGERVGGAEYQTKLIARGMIDHGHSALFIGADSSQAGESEHDGIRVVGVLGRRSIGAAAHARALGDVLSSARPDVCYVRDFKELAFVGPVCRALDIPCVSVSCHAMETSPFLTGYHPKDTWYYLRTQDALYHWKAFRSIRYSAAHVSNTKTLRDRVQRWFPRTPMRMIYNGSPDPGLPENNKAPSGQVIWVNNLKRWKRPEAYLDLAEALPDYRFVMVGRMAESGYGQSIKARIESAPPNLVYPGPKPIDETNDLIAESDLLLYTSLPVEGFGNSFLQAWYRSVPTISLGYELDGILEREGVGRCAANMSELIAVVSQLMGNHALRQAMGHKALDYARAHHTVERMVSQYEDLFADVAARTIGGPV